MHDEKAAGPLTTIWHADDALWAEAEQVLKELDPSARYGPADQPTERVR